MTGSPTDAEKPRRVLIAEDEALIRMDLAEMLREEGYEVVGEAGDGQEAVDLAESLSPDLVIMDEPTAALGVQETAKVEELIRKLRDDGHAVLLISHNFEQVLRLSDHVWVMRAGRCVGGRRTATTTGEEVVGLITGAIPA